MNEIGKNLKRIRLLKNLSLENAGNLLKMTAPAIAKYESGQIIPNSEKIIEFAKAYDVRIQDILKVHNQPNMKFTSFRKKQRLKGQNLELLKEIILNKVADYIEVINLNSTSQNNNKLKIYKCNNIDEIEEIASSFRNDYKLSINQPIPDLINILENIGIIIIQIDDIDNKFKDFDGVSEIVDNIPVIVLLKTNDGARERFTIAHELGHLLLKFNNDIDEEKACNKFAGSLLMPKEAMIKEFGQSRNKISIFELIAFKEEYKVSIASIVYRLRELGIISDYLNRSLNITINANGMRKKEPIDIKVEESNQFKKLVHRLEVDNIISINKACELLGVSIEEYNLQDNYNRY